MSDWPRSMEVRPIESWPGEQTIARKISPFRAGFTSTLLRLDDELRFLGVRGTPVLEVAIPAEQFRLDWRPRAQAKAEHPGVILTVATKLGTLRYPCDRFTTWQDNLRAIALSLEALRKVDRYGVTRTGEQYRGFLAIEATAPVLDPLEWLLHFIGGDLTDRRDPVALAAVIRAAKRKAHPDTGGDADLFQQVLDAERQIRDSTGVPPANG